MRRGRQAIRPVETESARKGEYVVVSRDFATHPFCLVLTLLAFLVQKYKC